MQTELKLDLLMLMYLIKKNITLGFLSSNSCVFFQVEAISPNKCPSLSDGLFSERKDSGEM